MYWNETLAVWNGLTSLRLVRITNPSVYFKQTTDAIKWVEVFLNGLSNVCGRQPLNWSEWSLQVFLKLSCKSFAWSILFNTWSHIFCLLSLVENSRRESVKRSKIFFSLKKYPLKLIKFWWRLDQKNIRVYIEPICKSTGYIEKTI